MQTPFGNITLADLDGPEDSETSERLHRENEDRDYDAYVNEQLFKEYNE